MQFPIDMAVLVRSVILILLVSAWSKTAAAPRECKTSKGQKCVCAASNSKRCATTAKAVCLNGKSVETPAGRLLTAHENNLELFRQCREMGGMKEIVSNVPLLDSFHNPSAPKTDTAAASE